jgi:hypothetical protein
MLARRHLIEEIGQPEVTGSQIEGKLQALHGKRDSQGSSFS